MAGTYVKKLGSVQFGFYTAAEAKQVGLVEINSSQIYDSSKVAVAGGLADPRLGVSPGLIETCSVCLQETSTCPGHLGYLPLELPVFNPFTCDILLKLLKSKCFFCHRLKITEEKADLFMLKFKLCNRGKLIDAIGIEDLLSRRVISESTFEGELIDTVLAEKEVIEEIAMESAGTGSSAQFSTLSRVSDEIKSQVWKTIAVGICPHCKLKQPKIKKENDNKIIREPFKEK